MRYPIRFARCYLHGQKFDVRAGCPDCTPPEELDVGPVTIDVGDNEFDVDGFMRAADSADDWMRP